MEFKVVRYDIIRQSGRTLDNHVALGGYEKQHEAARCAQFMNHAMFAHYSDGIAEMPVPVFYLKICTHSDMKRQMARLHKPIDFDDKQGLIQAMWGA